MKQCQDDSHVWRYTSDYGYEFKKCRKCGLYQRLEYLNLNSKWAWQWVTILLLLCLAGCGEREAKKEEYRLIQGMPMVWDSTFTIRPNITSDDVSNSDSFLLKRMKALDSTEYYKRLYFNCKAANYNSFERIDKKLPVTDSGALSTVYIKTHFVWTGYRWKKLN